MEARPATSADLDKIAEVHVRSWQETYVGQVPQDYLDALSIEDRRRVWKQVHAETAASAAAIFALVAEGEVVGFTHVGPSGDDDAMAQMGEVNSIYIRRTHWSRGGGRALMAAALHALAAEGFTAATLWVLDTNVRARKFYEAMGWKLDGAEKLHVIGGARVREVRYTRAIA